MLLRRGNTLLSIKSLSSVNLVCPTRKFSLDSFATTIALKQHSGKRPSKVALRNADTSDRESTKMKVLFVCVQLFRNSLYHLSIKGT